MLYERAGRRRGAVPRLPSPLPHHARQERHVPGPRQPRRRALRHHLRQGLQRRGRPHREEAALPLLPGHHGALAGQRGLQLRLPALPELADRARRPGRGRRATCATCPSATSPVLAANNECQGVAWTYNEPTIWLEYILDGAQAAHEHGLYTVMVTNGYITEEALDVLGPAHRRLPRRRQGLQRRAVQGALPHPATWRRCSTAAERAKTELRLPRRDRHQRHPDLQRRRRDAARHRRLDRRQSWGRRRRGT